MTILINNAGIGPFGHFLNRPLESHMGTLQTNLTSLTELCYRFGEHMRKHGRRSFISNIASIAAFQGVPRFAVYSGTKAYVRVFSEVLQRELAGTSVSVTCVCPGGTYTEFSDANGQVLTKTGHSAMMSAEAVVRIGLKGMIKGSPVVVPGLINKLACFLPRLVPRSLALSFANLAMSRSANELETGAPIVGPKL